jgi:hypothetical protein
VEELAVENAFVFMKCDGEGEKLVSELNDAAVGGLTKQAPTPISF